MDIATIKSVWSKMNNWAGNLPKAVNLADSLSNPPEIGMCKLWTAGNKPYMGIQAHPKRINPAKPCIAKLSTTSVLFDNFSLVEARQGNSGVDSYILPIGSSKLVISGVFEGTEYWQEYDPYKPRWNDEDYPAVIKCKYKFTIQSATLEFLASWKDEHLTIDSLQIIGNSKLEYGNCYDTISQRGVIDKLEAHRIDDSGQKILFDINYTAASLKADMLAKLNQELNK